MVCSVPVSCGASQYLQYTEKYCIQQLLIFTVPLSAVHTHLGFLIVLMFQHCYHSNMI